MFYTNRHHDLMAQVNKMESILCCLNDYPEMLPHLLEEERKDILSKIEEERRKLRGVIRFLFDLIEQDGALLERFKELARSQDETARIRDERTGRD